MRLSKALELLSQGHKIRHKTWDEYKYVEMGMTVVDEDGDECPITVINSYDLEGWEQYLPDGWYTQNGRDYLKYDTWNIWDYATHDWGACGKPEQPYLKQEGTYHPANYRIESRLVDDIPF